MSVAPYPVIGDERGVVTALEESFLTALRQPLAGLALVAGKETRAGDWGNEEHTWQELAGMSGVVLSMEIPPPQGDSGKSTRYSIEVPIWTKDAIFGGRKWRQLVLSFQRSGQSLDGTLTQDIGEAMAVEMNRQILFGSGSGMPGSTTGLLNHTGVQTTAGGDWTDPDEVNADLGEAFGTVLARRHRGDFTLLMNPIDSIVFNNFIADSGGQRIGSNLPSAITRLLYDEEVVAGTAYVVNNRAGNYDWLAPRDDPENGLRFGIGNITTGRVDNAPAMAVTGTRQERVDDLMKQRIVRFLNIGTVRPLRTGARSFAQKITFSTS